MERFFRQTGKINRNTFLQVNDKKRKREKSGKGKNPEVGP